jgi:hypothetical protein
VTAEVALIPGLAGAPGQFAAAVVIALVLLVLLVLAARAVLRRRAGLDTSLAEARITGAEDVLSVLRLAMKERSRFELGLPHDEGIARTINLTPIEIGSGSLIMSLPGFLTISGDWRGKTVECFFSVTVQGTNSAYYRFRSTVMDLRPVSGASGIVLSFPQELALRHKRDSLRVRPPEALVEELELWLVKSERAFRDGADTNGNARIRFAHGEQSPLRILDISAGGIRIELKPGLLPFALPIFRPSGYIAISLTLAGSAPGRSQSWLIVGRIRHLALTGKAGTIEMGVQFSMAGAKDDRSSAPPRMSNVGRQGIEPLGRWVFERHLELYRQGGLTWKNPV